MLSGGLTLLLLAGVWPVAAQPQDCTPSVQRESLFKFYEQTGGPSWNITWKNSTEQCNGTSVNKTSVNSTVQLPPHCCLHGVTCCTDLVCPGPGTNYTFNRTQCGCREIGLVTALRLPRNNLQGAPGWVLGSLSCELKMLDLTFNQISGTLGPAIAQFTNLAVMGLGYNRMTGTLPKELGYMTNLQTLDLSNNQFNGTVPSNLCNDTNESALTDMLLGGNQFSGEFKVNHCSNLVLLDIQNNSLSGPIPDFTGFDKLHIARLTNNNFTAGVPKSIQRAHYLTDFDISNNSLTGTIPSSITDMSILSRVLMVNNSLTGTLPAGLLTDLGILTLISLAGNNLTGTIPPSIHAVPTVTYLDFSDNYLVGTIPESFAVYAAPDVTVNLRLTFLSCCGLNPLEGLDLFGLNYTYQAYTDVNWSAVADPKALLPSFLAFSSFQQPVAGRLNNTYANMRCPGLRLATAPADTILNWDIDPDYFNFQGCACELGYNLVNLTEPGKLPFFMCQQAHISWAQRYPWAIALIILGAILLLLLLLFLACYRKGARPAFLQQYHNVRKRLHGEPREGELTVVTTDIEGYSDLMKREPDAMGKGLRIHNFCIDAARWQFFGYTMEQEGDSFTIAFHEPFDGVAFCLMAQQLLNAVEWPERLVNAEGMARPRQGPSGILSSAFQSAARLILERDTGRRSSVKTEGSSMPAPLAAATLVGVGSLGETSAAESAESAPATTTLGVTTEDSLVSSQGSKRTGKLARLFQPRRSDPIKEELPGLMGSEREPSSLGMVKENAQSPGSIGIRLSSANPQQVTLFRGLRVRMGVATGRLERGMSLRSSHIMERAKVVSDAGAGGQILLDEPTMQAIKDRLLELGAVDLNGLSVANMNLSRPTLLMEMFGCQRAQPSPDVMAWLLDMGLYVRLPRTPRRNPIVHLRRGNVNQLAAAQQEKDTDEAADQLPTGRRPPVPGSAAAVAATAAAAAAAAAVAADSNPNKLHLYQILSPCLVGRATMFGTKIALHSEWLCVEPPNLTPPGGASTASDFGPMDTTPQAVRSAP